MIRAFLDWYGRTVCISTNRQLKDKFSDELDFCIALDMNSPGPKEDRTEIGEWRYQAKFKQNVDARAALASKLCRAVRMLPLAKVPIPRLLSYVPSDPGKDFCLPAELAKAVRTGIPKTFWGVDDPLVVPTLTTSKKPAKDLTVAQKIAEKVAEAKRIRLSQSVKGRSVIVVDDLYQSGVSLWSFARYLKAQQAVAVFGVACVKSLRDTDNQ
jgi:predicted amidophosphoribosyltransferase